MPTIDAASKPPPVRDRLLLAAFGLIRGKGFSATSVDDLCTAAGVTKGAFFHHFASKEALGVAAAAHWGAVTAPMFAAAPYHDHADPLDRVLAYLDFRAGLIEGSPAEFSCLAGMLVQETYATSPAIRAACNAAISDHAATLEADIAAALVQYGVRDVTAASLALHTQAVLQGAFVLAKARCGPAVAIDSIAHLRRYVLLLFQPSRGDRQ
ncbi:MAG: TetR/AcrR family transcriptional regulator [Alphaproteobacteria bacterium]|nr:TetR/AcrR family transcriptional regulator [Alphaproteobacteria bacterium]